MSIMRKQWSLHTTAGAVPILGGSWAFDRSWAPQGAGSVVLPLDHPGVFGLIAHDRQPLRLVCDLWGTLPGGSLGAGVFSGATLGDAGWPAEPVELYPATSGGVPLIHKRVTWHVWPQTLRRDRAARELTLGLATVELLLVETVNMGDPWMPAPTGPGGSYRLSDVLLELTRYLRIPLVVQPSAAAVDLALVEPWARGESAWSWLEGLRAAAGMSYRYDPNVNRLRYVAPTEAATGALADDWLELAEDVGGTGQSGGLRYADALLLTWRWTDPDGAEQTLDEVALAPGVPSWRAARRPLRLEWQSRPQAGAAARMVAQLARWRTTATPTTPLDQHTLTDLVSGRGATAQSVAFDLGDEPRVRFTLITED